MTRIQWLLLAFAVVSSSASLPPMTSNAQSSTAPASQNSTAPASIIFDATAYSNKPVVIPGYGTGSFGPPPMGVLYDSRSTEEVARKFARGMRDSGIFHVCLDMEDNHGTNKEIAVDIKKRVLWIKEEVPEMKVGVYGFPFAQYWPAWSHLGGEAFRNKAQVQDPELAWWGTSGAETAAKNYATVQRMNDDFAELLNALDFGAPGCYTVHTLEGPGMQNWSFMLDMGVKETARMMPGKPCYPFLWNRYADYADPAELHFVQIKPEHFRQQVAWCVERANGAVLWGGWNVGLKREVWDPQAPWYQEMVKAGLLKAAGSGSPQGGGGK